LILPKFYYQLNVNFNTLFKAM